MRTIRPSNLFSGKPAVPMRTTAPTDALSVVVSNSLLVNGDFEQGTLGWSQYGSSTLTSETFPGCVAKGTKSLRVVSPAGTIYGACQDVVVQAGEWLQIRASIRSDSAPAALSIINMDTIQGLNAATGGWDGTGEVFRVHSAAMTACTPFAFQVESLARVGKPTTTLRIYLLHTVPSQEAWFDEVLLTRGYNFVGVFGNNMPASAFMRMFQTADYWHGGAESQIGQAMYMTGPTVGMSLPMTYAPRVNLYFTPASYGRAPWIGELVLGQAEDLLQNPEYPITIEHAMPNLRLPTSGGATWVLPPRTSGARSG